MGVGADRARDGDRQLLGAQAVRLIAVLVAVVVVAMLGALIHNMLDRREP